MRTLLLLLLLLLQMSCVSCFMMLLLLLLRLQQTPEVNDGFISFLLLKRDSKSSRRRIVSCRDILAAAL